MSLTVPNLDKLVKENPELGEAIQKVQSYINSNVSPANGNRVNPPSSVVNPTQPPG